MGFIYENFGNTIQYTSKAIGMEMETTPHSVVRQPRVVVL